MQVTCPCCQGSGFVEDNPVEKRLREECERRQFQIRWPDLVGEDVASYLLGYSSADALRKQASDGVSCVEFVMRGNRRFYSIKKISDYLTT